MSKNKDDIIKHIREVEQKGRKCIAQPFLILLNLGIIQESDLELKLFEDHRSTYPILEISKAPIITTLIFTLPTLSLLLIQIY